MQTTGDAIALVVCRERLASTSSVCFYLSKFQLKTGLTNRHE